MSTKSLYRASAVLFVVFAVAHTVGFLTFTPPSQDGVSVRDAMERVQFTVAGSTFSYGAFYRGFGPFGHGVDAFRGVPGVAARVDRPTGAKRGRIGHVGSLRGSSRGVRAQLPILLGSASDSLPGVGGAAGRGRATLSPSQLKSASPKSSSLIPESATADQRGIRWSSIAACHANTASTTADCCTSSIFTASAKSTFVCLVRTS